MTSIILGFAISYIIALIVVRNRVNIENITPKDLFQSAFLIFIFAGYWIALLILYIIEIIFN